MHGKKYDDTKKEIRSVLLTYQNGVTLDEFLKTYRGLLGQRLPSRDLGFSSDLAFLKSMPDVVDVHSESPGKVYLTGIADKTSEHIQKLVSRQRKSKTSNSKSSQASKQRYARQPVSKLPSTPPNTRELKPFLPGTLRAEIIELMKSHTRGLTLAGFALAYHRKFKKYLPLVNGLNSLEAMIKLIPEIEVGRNSNNEIAFYNRKSLNCDEEENGIFRKNGSPSGMTESQNVVQEKSSPNIHESGISDDILKDFQMILKRYPDGIQNIHFPPLYEPAVGFSNKNGKVTMCSSVRLLTVLPSTKIKCYCANLEAFTNTKYRKTNITGKQFDMVELGYNSMADLVETLPHIFERVPNPNDEQCWLIYPSGSSLKENLNAKKDADSHSKHHLYHHREGIPADASSPTLQYMQSTIPSYIDLNKYIPVFVSAIISPSLFWFQLQTDEYIEKFEKLEKDMWNFYSNTCDKYKMNSADIAIGATCVIQCPDDDQYYRAVIKSIPSTELINVSFVDYGSRDNVPRNNVYYVWSKFHDYPAYAFQAQLAGVKPPGNENSWSSKARKRFVELCNCATLMAFIKPIDKDSYSVYLCDTNNEDEDIHLHQVLINEEFAEICNQSQFDIKNCNSSGAERIFNVHNNLVDSDSGFTSNQDTLQSDNSSDSNELPINRKLSFSTELENNDVHPNSAHFSQDKKNTRYIKQVEVCAGNKIHLINLKNNLYISCGELCGLLWNEKNPSFLTRRLMHKEIDIPFLHVQKEDFTELFNQCLWYKISDFENKDSDNSPVILCPLAEAFNVLNIFGHPSVCLRIIIQHEMRIFDSNDVFWSEFSYEESHLSIAESDILEEINKLCLYDLKAKSEAYKIQKLKLLRIQTNPQSEEIRRIENILNIITRRMKQIEEICTQYSSCS